ncbi:hypothetical protein WA026_008840 [Henosepilachna vigintioctopunctata]|uniref:Uncharacterized protein n=1 Tax=Henosepilachna vigintioctopunctata TaxID=420089 RepID=A0AAW1V4M8_9CUCU
MMANMKKKYAEIVSKNGPLFKNLKYLERLNMEDSSLAKEKWTTELFERDVEVMPIIFEKEEDGHRDEPMGQFVNENSNETLSQTNNPAVPSEEEMVDDELQNLRRASGGKAWWIVLNEDTQINRLEQTNPLIMRPSPIENSKTCLENEPENNPAQEEKMEILFEKVAEAPYEKEKNSKEIRPIEDTHPIEQHVHDATYSQQDVGTSAKPLVASDNLDPLSSANKNEKSELKFPISDSNEKNLQEIKSGRIARPLSGKYCNQLTEDNLLKRTTSVMDLPVHTDKSDLSSLYDELYAEMIEKKSNPFSRKPKAMRPVLELFDNPNYGKLFGKGSCKNQAAPTNPKVVTDSSQVEKKDEKISRKRTHHDV